VNEINGKIDGGGRPCNYGERGLLYESTKMTFVLVFDKRFRENRFNTLRSHKSHDNV
jgi:transposase